MKYECGLAEHDIENGWTCPIDNPNETQINDCKDCCFAIEIEEE